jgi:hypothetical protein
VSYLVTAVVQDNRENTMKVCSRVDDPFEACDAILEELTKRPAAEGADLAERALIVKETWAILYLSCMHEDEFPPKENA